MGLVWEMKLKPVAKLVLLTLADHANDEGECYPSLSTIARKTGLSRSTVCEHLNRFATAGILRREAKSSKKGTTHYQINVYYLINRVENGGHPGALLAGGSPGAGLGWSGSRTTGSPGAGHDPSDQPSDNQDRSLRERAISILEFLNEQAGRRFPPTPANLRLIIARMKETDEQTCARVIATKVKQWRGTKMHQYLRPKTLFSPTNFSTYAGEIVDTNNDMS